MTKRYRVLWRVLTSRVTKETDWQTDIRVYPSRYIAQQRVKQLRASKLPIQAKVERIDE